MKGPSAKVASGVATAGAELTEEQELQRERDRIEARAARNFNKVAKLLGGQRYWYENHSFPFLVLDDRPRTVSEYYPEIKVAVDRFYSMDDWDKRETDFKAKAFKDAGIQYAFLTPQKSLADLHAELSL